MILSLDPFRPRRTIRARVTTNIAALAAALALVAAGCSSSDKVADTGPMEEALVEAPDSADAVPAGPVDEQLRVDAVGGVSIQSAKGSVRRFTPGTYLRRRSPGDLAAMHFSGLDGLTLDLSGVELRGQVADADLDRAAGVGIHLSHCKNVTIKGALIGGFKVCLDIVDCEGITVEGVHCDGWFGQRLRSTRYSEDLTDWLRPHENDHDEWKTNYGAGISVTNSSGVEIRECRGRRGQNGILLTRVTDSKVYDNDFSFMSGWGIGMYRSSNNVVAHNVCDYCIRGFSHEVYWRGQDSAGILMFESCSDNVIALNSATHGGHGVFLFGGNDIVERGLSGATGSDDNVFFGNDLRFAVANSVEATFSRGNVILGNSLSGSHQHGVLGGYSSDMLIKGNAIDETIGAAIKIEHGQGCIIVDNHIALNEIGVELYWSEDPELVNGPFGRQHDTSSKDHWILDNHFDANVLDFVMRETTGLVFHGNSYVPGTREPYFESVTAEADPSLDGATVQRWLDALDGSFPSGNLSTSTLNPWVGQAPALLEEWSDRQPQDLPGRQNPSAEARDEFGGGLESIVMTEWGPWDFRSGALRPKERRAGGLFADATWNTLWFRWKAGDSDPRTSDHAWRARANTPILRAEVESFVNPWVTEDNRRLIGNDFFGVFAATNVHITQPGQFVLSVVSDDGIRVFVDEELVLEDWTLHAPKRDEVTLTLTKGEHIIRFEYFQIQGAAALVLELRAH